MPTTTAEKKYLGLTEEEFHRFRRACNSTWQAIGGDILDAGGGRDIPRSTVVEVVLDAGYLLTYGEQGGRPRLKLGTVAQGDQFVATWPSFYNERLNPWVREHYNTAAFKRLMKEVFPYARYGN
jgi:hypothetical protein